MLARIKAGDRYDPDLLAGLDKVDQVIATRALDALAGKVNANDALRSAIRVVHQFLTPVYHHVY